MEARIVSWDQVQYQVKLSLHTAVGGSMDEVVVDWVEEDDEIGETQSFDPDLGFHNSTQKWMGNVEASVDVAGSECLRQYLRLQFVCHDTFD